MASDRLGDLKYLWREIETMKVRWYSRNRSPHRSPRGHRRL